MSRVEIRGEQHTISEVFSERYAFIIPPFQRPYAWTIEHTSELLIDLLDALGQSEEPVEDLPPYFLGSIVLIKGERPDALIVDGQQRLITLTILLAALRTLVPDEFAESITRRLYEPADPLKSIPARFRVVPKERDAEFFRDYIQSEDGLERLRARIHNELPASQQNMRDNAIYLLSELDKLPEPRRVRLAQYIAQNCLLVVVSTPDLSSAYRIFSVLNNRGLDLSNSDMLKAEIIGKFDLAEQESYSVKWDNCEESLGRDAFSDLFTHIRTVFRKTCNSASILDGFRADVIETVGDPARLIDDVLLPYGAAYYVIRNTTYQHADSTIAQAVNAMLRWLNRLDNSDWVPPGLLYLSLYHESPERLLRFFTQLERLAASMMIRRQFGDKREKRYRALLQAIQRGDNLSHASSPIQLMPHEREATVAALSGDIYLMTARPRNYLLERLDASLADVGAVYYHDSLTVEHVLPRNPPADSEWRRLFTAEERARWTHRLGNLVLLSRVKNERAGNYDFATKKARYFAGKDGISPFALTMQVLRETEWTPKVIERRQRELIAHLSQLWRL